MKKLIFKALCFLSIALSFSLQGIHPLPPVSISFQDDLFDVLNKIVYDTPNIPQKEEVISLLKTLQKQGYVIEEGSDDLRVKYVALQGFIEKNLAIRIERKEIVKAIGMIHTPMPATPLCTEGCRVDPNLLADSLRADMEKAWTIYARAQIVRNYLGLGGILYVIYPQGGLEKRTPQQQDIYKKALSDYPLSLIDQPVPIGDINPDMIGATYLFRNDQNRFCAFSIQSRQANDPQDLSKWGIWFGYLDQKEIAERVDEVLSYIEASGGPTKDEIFAILNQNPTF